MDVWVCAGGGRQERRPHSGDVRALLRRSRQELHAERTRRANHSAAQYCPPHRRPQPARQGDRAPRARARHPLVHALEPPELIAYVLLLLTLTHRLVNIVYFFLVYEK